MKRILFILTTLFFINTALSGQYVKTPLFQDSDVINIQFIPGDGYFYYHKIKKGHTLYSISKTFNIPVQQLYVMNDMDRSTPISIGQVIKIPIDARRLVQAASTSGPASHLVPVYYTVKPKETLFRIAKIYFNQEVNDLRDRNNLSSNELEIGEHLLVGWLSTEPSHRPIHEIKENIEVFTTTSSTTYRVPKIDSIRNDSVYVVVDSVSITFYPVGFRADLLGGRKFVKGMSMQSENTVAHWDKTIPDNGVAYALHNEAKPNTYIELYNPNLNRSIIAKVIGKIPFGTYTSDVKLLVSPRAAKMLGGLDHRFRVKTTYIKD